MLDRIVEVFCEVDDFCKAFLPQWEAFLIGPGGPAPRGPQPGLSTSEIITLLLVLHSSGFKHLKSFYHGFAEPLLRGYFPGLPCYEHFVALQKSAFVPLVFFLAQPPGDQDRALLHRLHGPAGLRQSSHQPAQGLRRSCSTWQDLDGLVLRLQAAPRLQHRQ